MLKLGFVCVSETSFPGEIAGLSLENMIRIDAAGERLAHIRPHLVLASLEQEAVEAADILRRKFQIPSCPGVFLNNEYLLYRRFFDILSGNTTYYPIILECS